MSDGWIDLHAHTTASDGTLAPAELVELARDQGISALGITDHDTVAGLDEALQAAEHTDLELIPGVEISVDVAVGSMHVLGYFIRHRHPSLLARLVTLQRSRGDRNPKIIARLNGQGVAITMEEVRSLAGGSVIGRAHIAAVIKAKGYARSVQNAFDRYLKKGRPAYVDRYRLDPETAFAAIHEAGGVCSLAHPCTISEDPRLLEPLVRRFKTVGLDAIEAYYPDQDPSQTSLLLGWARKYDLGVTGGTDFHGLHKPGLSLGSAYGSFRVPSWVLEDLKARHRTLAAG